MDRLESSDSNDILIELYNAVMREILGGGEGGVVLANKGIHPCRFPIPCRFPTNNSTPLLLYMPLRVCS